MAHLWMSGEQGSWLPTLLEGEAFALDDGRPMRVPALSAAALSLSRVGLRRIDDVTGAVWTLLTRPGAHVLVNGVPVRHGIVVLADRDQLRFPAGPTLFFSTETLAGAVPFPATGVRGFCPRCKQALAGGELAVKCPGCHLWHHASDHLPCWTYAEHCAACAQETTLDAGFRWTPEEL